MKIVLSFFLFITVHSYAQLPPILTSSKKRGIYKTFEEFKNNNPSLIFDFQLLNDTATFVDILRYKLKFDKSIKFHKDSVWGVCDGNQCYILDGGGFRKKSKFDRIIFLGRYCIFNTSSGTQGGSYNGGFYSGGSWGYVEKKAIDINTGEIFIIDKPNTKRIIQRDFDLNKEFVEDKDRNKKYWQYLKRYSEAHVEEIK